MNRVLLSLLVVLILLASNGVRPAKAADDVLTADVMKVALHTSTQQEEGFIEYVLYLVDKGLLPRSLVQSTFLWARKKPNNKKFYYFREGLILRAAKQGITL